MGPNFFGISLYPNTYNVKIAFIFISSYGVLVGTGAGLSFPPTVYIVTSYFVRLRGLANGICISGSAFGSIILPPILRYLLEEYGYRGAILIMGGITLNTWVAALFYEPVENHMKRVPKDSLSATSQIDENNDVIDEEDEGITLEFAKQIKNSCEETSTKILPRNVEHTHAFTKTHITNSIKGSSSAAIANVRNQNDETNQHLRKISTPVKLNYVSKNESFLNQLNSSSSLYAVPDSRFSHSSRLNRLNQYRTVSRPPKRSPSTSSFQYVSTPYHGSTLSFQPEAFASHLSLKSIASSINPMAACSKQKKTKSKFLDLTLLKDPVYLVILISNSTNAIGYTNFIILLPTFATTLGFDKNLAAYLLYVYCQ